MFDGSKWQRQCSGECAATEPGGAGTDRGGDGNVMKVLITGAGGNLGRVVVPALVEQGHTPRLMDFRQLETAHEFVQGDVRYVEQVRRAVAEVDAVVDDARLHGSQLRNW